MKAILHKSSRWIGINHPVALVTGDGRSLLDDLDRVKGLGLAYDVAAIGRSVKLFDAPAHWFNADGETAMAWAKQIKAERGSLTHTLGEVDGFDCDWDIEQPDYNYEAITHQKGRMHGSSALFATLACLAMGYEQIILAGCPMDSNGHWYFEPDSPDTLGPLWLGVDYAAWLDFAQEPDAAKVRSMSGYTARILGNK